MKRVACSTRTTRRTSAGLVAVSLTVLCACGDDPVDFFGERTLPVCDLPAELMYSSAWADAIPSLIEPEMVHVGHPDLDYLADDDRVMGVVIDGQARAYPHNLLWHHEIVSDRQGDRWITATYCPLTGSGLVFDPRLGSEVLDVGVSGLLFANNLVLYDRTSGDVYGPQLAVEGSCSRFRDTALDVLPVQEMSWGRWRVLHPSTLVVSGDTGFERDYRRSPYAGYDRIGNDSLLFEMAVDDSRPLKERVLAIRDGDGGVGYPFRALAELGDDGVVNDTVVGEPTAIFWEGGDVPAAVAFDARVDGETLTFEALGDGVWTDVETGSSWGLDGVASQGPLAGRRLAVRTDAFVVFWFAWRHFQPAGTTWTR